MVAAAGDVYSENLAFGAHAVGFSRHWKEEYQLLARNFEQLQAERRKAPRSREPRTSRCTRPAAPRPPLASCRSDPAWKLRHT